MPLTFSAKPLPWQPAALTRCCFEVMAVLWPADWTMMDSAVFQLWVKELSTTRFLQVPMDPKLLQQTCDNHIHKSHFGRMNLHKSQMLSCEQKGTRVLIHQVIITRYFSKMMALLWPLDWMTKGNVTFHLWTPQGRTLKSLQAMYIRYCSEMTAVQ